MLTQEQIKNLKPGDPVVVRGEFKSVDDDGDFWIKTDNCYRCYDPLYVSLPSEHGTSVPTPKHDPTRLFKEGDIVKRRIVDGRTDIDVAEGINLTVTRGEGIYGNLVVKEPNGRSIVTKSVFLELITPVEELEPYKLIDSPNTYNIVRDSAMVMTIHKKSHPNAKAAAEAERDRLNAEHRKEQK